MKRIALFSIICLMLIALGALPTMATAPLDAETSGPMTATAEWAGCIGIARIEVKFERNIRTSPSKKNDLNLNKTILPGSQEIAVDRVANDEGEWYRLCSLPGEKLRYIYTSDRTAVTVILTATRTPSPTFSPNATPTRLVTNTPSSTPTATSTPESVWVRVRVFGADMGILQLRYGTPISVEIERVTLTPKP